jgi:hypothetical protein
VVAGTIDGLGLGKPLAVAVDGRVVAATRSVGTPEGGVRYEAVLPPSVYEAGVSDVRVLMVDKRGGFKLLGES